jgi:hypothetical protein
MNITYSHSVFIALGIQRVMRMRSVVICRPSVGTTLLHIRADSHYTSRFRSVAERHRSVKFSHV